MQYAHLGRLQCSEQLLRFPFLEVVQDKTKAAYAARDRVPMQQLMCAKMHSLTVCTTSMHSMIEALHG